MQALLRHSYNKDIGHLAALDEHDWQKCADAVNKGTRVPQPRPHLTPAKRAQLKRLYGATATKFRVECGVPVHDTTRGGPACHRYYHQWAQPPVNFITGQTAARRWHLRELDGRTPKPSPAARVAGGQRV